MQRIALGVEYNGHDFFGWQKQEKLITVQGTLESALEKIADHSIKLFCAGRTDAGVHALGQVVHFDTEATRNMRAWVQGTNTHLPPEISVRWAQLVNDQFHARFSALSRSYRYIIYNSSVRSAITARSSTWYYHSLDVQLMQYAGHFLIGEHDFSSFRSSECESLSPMRHVQKLSVIRQDDFVIIEIKANAFLHHMVRNIAGVLMRIGAGFQEPEWIREVLHAQDRRQAAETASPRGLYLQHVEYSDNYPFPTGRNLIL